MGYVATKADEKTTLGKTQKPETEVSANKQQTPAFDQLKDPLADPLGGQGPQGSGETPDPANATGDLTPGTGGKKPKQGDNPDEKPSEGSSDPTNAKLKDKPPGSPGDGPKDGEGSGDPQAIAQGDKGDKTDKDETGDKGDKGETTNQGETTGAKTSGSGAKTGNKGDKEGNKDETASGGGDSGGGDTAQLMDSGSGGSGGSGGGSGGDGALKAFPELSESELSEYVNEKAWHDYWVNRSDTGMGTSDKWWLVGRALGAGALEGLVNGVSAGVVHGIAASAMKKMRFAGGVFTAVEFFRMGPKNWVMQGPEKFKGAYDKLKTGDVVDRVEGVIDILDGINTIIGQISGICMLVAGLGSIVAVASIFMPFLLPIVPFLLTVIPLAAKWGMILGRLSGIMGAVLTLLRLVPITMRAVQIVASDADPAVQAARAEKLSKQVSSFTEDASSRLVKTGVEKGIEKGSNKISSAMGKNKVSGPSEQPQQKVDATDKKIGTFKKLMGIAFDAENLNKNKIKENFGKINENFDADKSATSSLKGDAKGYRGAQDAYSTANTRANKLDQIKGQRLTDWAENKSDAKLDKYMKTSSKAYEAQNKADAARKTRGNARGQFGRNLGGFLTGGQRDGSEEISGDAIKAYRDLYFGSKAKAGTDGTLEAIKGLPDDGSVGGTDLADDKLKDRDPELYKLKMDRARNAIGARQSFVGSERTEIRQENMAALSDRVKANPQGATEYVPGQMAYSDRLMDLGQATSRATVDAELSVDQRTGMSEDQQKARNNLRPKIQAAMDKVSAMRDQLQALPPPPESQESVLTNASDNATLIEAEIQALEAQRGEIAQQKAAAEIQRKTAERAVVTGEQNRQAADDERRALDEKAKKRDKARQDIAERQSQTGSAMDPMQGIKGEVMSMVMYLLKIAGVLPDSVGGDKVKAANPKGLGTGMEKAESGGKDAKAGLGEGQKAMEQQGRLGAMASNWLNSGLAGLLKVNSGLARDLAETRVAQGQYETADKTLVERLKRLEDARAAQRQRHATAMASIQDWTTSHRAKRLKGQETLDASMNEVDQLLAANGQPTSASM